MKTNQFAITTLVVLLGTAPLLLHASDQPSKDWLEAKNVFAPVNVLREKLVGEDAENKPGTTVRVLDANGKKDLTVFPAANSQQNSLKVTKVEPTQEPQITGLEMNSAASSSPTFSVFGQPTASSPQADLVLLPQVEPLASSFLTGSHENSQVAYAAQEYLAQGEIPEGVAKEMTEGEYNQSQGSVEWSEPVAGHGCCDGGCDGCCDTCCSCCKPCCPCIMVAGVEAVFLSPDINGRPVSYVYTDDATPETVVFGPGSGQAAMNDLYGAPRIWLGAQGCRWGIVGRFYQYQSNEHDHDLYDITAVPPPTEHSYDVNNLLEAYYADIELTRNFCIHGCKNQLTFGARYARIEHHESIYGRSGTDPNNGGLLSAYARRNRTARGTGLTMSLNGRKPLFPCSCCHWFYNARGSILWGRTSNEVESEASVIAAAGGAVGAAGSIDGAAVSLDDDLFIGEVQAGLQWDFALRCLPAKAFFRTAFEYQYWDAGMGSATSLSTAGLIEGGTGTQFDVTTSSWAPGLVVDFVGFSVGSGFTW